MDDIQRAETSGVLLRTRLAYAIERGEGDDETPSLLPGAREVQTITNPDGTTVLIQKIAIDDDTEVEVADLSGGKKLKVIGRAGVGVDNIDVPAATQRGIVVMNTPGGNTTSAAELTMSLIMALARNIPAAVSSMKAGKWERSKFMGTELSGKTVGIVGLGRIGREVARWCQAFGMITIGYDPVMAPDVAAKAGITPVSLEQLWAQSDIITLHAPKTPETANLIRAETLAKCKTGVKIVNVARGGIVHEGDLLEALESGKVLVQPGDVIDNPFDLA
jgi:D-3-phosphoglycerate dehydrogenase